MKQLNRMFRCIAALAIAMSLSIGSSAYALPEAEGTSTGYNPGEVRGPVRAIDDVNCTWDYIGFRWTASGGQGGHGATVWPSGYYGGNYGEMCFVRDCDNAIDTVYAYCYDIDHGLETGVYCVETDSAVIDEDSCSVEQITAVAYLLAWCCPDEAFEDDVLQLALWKLATDLDPVSPTYGIPFVCVDDLDNPNDSYPYINTVYGTNAARNAAANQKVLMALGSNVAMEDDPLLPSNDPAVVGETTSTVTVRICVERGDRADAVGNDGLAGIHFDAQVIVGNNLPYYVSLVTDENGCAEFDVDQPVSDNSYEDVLVTFCTRTAWPVHVRPCDGRLKQELLLAPDCEENLRCTELQIPGDNWLPVELASFDAVNSADGVDLSWSTASETAVEFWEIERRVSGTANFSVLAIVDAANSPTGHHYTYFDRLGVNGNSYDYRLVDVGFDGSRNVHPTVESASYGSFGAGRVTEYELADAYPNPFNPSTTIRYAVPEAGLVKITVYDVNGREIAELVNGYIAEGHHSVKFDAASLASGTYFYRMTAADFSMTKRFMLLK